MTAISHAQSGPSTNTFVVALTYDAAYSGLTTGRNNFWMQGGSIEIAGTAWHGFGAAANVTGLHSGNTGKSVPLNLVIATFGPRYTWTARKQRMAIFGQGLVGEANGFRSLFPSPGAATDSANSLAVLAGGGVDLGLRQHLSLRLLQASWLRTQLPNANTGVQNNLLLGTGIVFRLGQSVPR
jgi:hypothetical protein